MSQEASGGAARPAAPAAGTSAAAAPPVQGFTPLPTGARIGELVVQSLLGAGEFGITYVAEHVKRSKRYALKEYFPRAICYRDGSVVRPRQQFSAAYAWGLDRFLSEARALQQVKHPALVALFGVTQHGGTGFAGMAYEQGRDFNIWLHEQQRIAPQEEIDKILNPLLEGLALAHASKVFHFDLNPDCIIIRDNGTPVIVDFGVFRVGLRRRLPPGNIKAQIYAAPELLATAGGPIGPWTDIYSLAGLLYLSVTGKPPLSAVERASGAQMPTAVSASQGEYRSSFLEAIDAGLRLAPAQRPKSLPEWSRLLQRTSNVRFGVSLPWFRRLRTAATPQPHAQPMPARQPPPQSQPRPQHQPQQPQPARPPQPQHDPRTQSPGAPPAQRPVQEPQPSAPPHPLQTPAQHPLQTPAQHPLQTPAQHSLQTPAHHPLQTPAQHPLQTPAPRPAPPQPPSRAETPPTQRPAMPPQQQDQSDGNLLGSSYMDDLIDRRSAAPETVPLMENRAFRAVFFALVGLLGGGVAGGLSSVIVASLLRPECAGDNCVAPFVLPLAAVGAVIGVWEGIRYAGKPLASAKGYGEYEL